MKKILLIVLIIGLIVVLYLSFRDGKTSEVIEEGIVIDDGKIVSLCFDYQGRGLNDIKDTMWLRMDMKGGQIYGDFANLPAEKDSKVGSFNGVVGPLEQDIAGRTAHVTWKAFAEGTEVLEELIIQFGEGSAVTFWGEMVEGGEGVYVYKDLNNLTPSETMSQIDCDALNEKLEVQKFVIKNIKDIATNDPVLGGSWHGIDATIIPSTKTGEVVYEDGHIRSKATFSYEINGEEIIISDFEVGEE